MSNHPSSFVKRVSLFSSATLISRILGYARDASVAYVFGGGYFTDTFYTAFRVSNLLRRLLGEGALSSSFVPVFSQTLHTQTKEETQNFINSIFTSLLIILLVLTALGIGFAPYLTKIIAPGFTSMPEKFEMTVLLTRLIFPFFLFISLAALTTAILNSLKHFFLPAAAPAMLSIAEMGYLFLLIPVLSMMFKNFTFEYQIVGLSIAVVAGGLGHFAVQLPQLFKEKFYFKWRWQWKHPQTFRVVKNMLPIMFGLSVDQINAFIGTICATFLAEGSVTALYNSNRVMQLPLALFGIAIANVALPVMSDHTAQNNQEQFTATINQSLRMVLFAVLPASVGLMVLAHPICEALFQHGRFTSFATELTSNALIGYSFGLLAYSAVKVLANAFYALQEPKIPVQAAAVCIGLNVLLVFVLIGPLGVGGIGLAAAIASWVNAGWLWILIRKRATLMGVSIDGKRLSVTFFKTMTACFIMFLYLMGLLFFGKQLNAVWQVLFGVLGGAGIFMLMAKILKIEEQKLILHIAGINPTPEQE